MCRRGISSSVSNGRLPATTGAQSPGGVATFVPRPFSPDRTLSGMSVLSSRSLLVGVYACSPGGKPIGGADRRITVVPPPSSADKQPGSDPSSRCDRTKDDATILEELTFDGGDKGRARKRFPDLRREAVPIAVGRCLPMGGVFLFFVRWRSKSKRRLYDGDYDAGDEMAFAPVPDEIFVQLRNNTDAGHSLPIRCRVAASHDRDDDQSVWIGTVANAGRLIEPSQLFVGENNSKTERMLTTTDWNKGRTVDDASAASSVTLTVNLNPRNDVQNRARCVTLSLGVTETPAIHGDASKKSVSLFNGFYT